MALGGTYVWKDGRDHTDTFHAVLDYPEGFLFDWGMGLGNAPGGHFTVHGTKATLDADRWTVEPRARGRNQSRSRPSQACRTWKTGWSACARGSGPTRISSSATSTSSPP